MVTVIVIKRIALTLCLTVSVQYYSNTVSSLGGGGELSVLIPLLATLQKWLFKSSGEIPLVVLLFAGRCLLVRHRLIVRHVSFEFLLFAKMSAKHLGRVSDHVDDYFFSFFFFFFFFFLVFVCFVFIK